MLGRAWLVAAAALAAVPAAVPAQADDPAVFQVVVSRSTFLPGDDELGATTLYVSSGQTLTLTNLDAFAAHGLSSDAIVAETGERLFESGVLNLRDSALVRGVQSLPAGSYPFHCPVHEDNMHGVLVVP
ncbi:MAG TPA: cupredoxin domain-containing protein [Acidimicrobiales bacterium]|jgi:plastocyanin|nr:cupredoxin domain-containing protein [Acidimicrobiales bacterium]